MFEKGLSNGEIVRLRSQFGENTLPVKEDASALASLISQFKSPLIYILIFATFISLVFRQYSDALLTGVVLVLNALMGFFQEYRAQKTLAALKMILKPTCLVIRNGKRRTIDSRDLVPGDLVILSAGDKVPADGELLKSTNLLINEAILTGEEEASEKTLQKKKNLLFMGTTVISGSGTMRVTKIGKETQIGKISQSLVEIKEGPTPLQVKLQKFAKNLAYMVAAVCLAIFVIGLLHQENIIDMARLSIILSVAAIPEGLPIAVTVILTLGIHRILKRNGLVKKLLSIETLGSTSVICTDKTGTLTEGSMRVVKTHFLDEPMATLALILANDQKTNLEVCLWDYLKKQKKANPQKIFVGHNRIYEEPFDSNKKYMMTINKINGREIAFIKGAPEIILSFCGSSDHQKEDVLREIREWADEGLKLIGVIGKEGENLTKKEGFSWLGLVALQDPIREGVDKALLEAKEAGIRTIIVTGDYRLTAERVARKLGFNLSRKNILEGQELEKISREELRKKVDNIYLFSRVTPQQKLKIVEALQDRGEVVAMTGDGVNDAPALKKADIGVAMGTSSDVAKEASDLILLDNNYATIVAACEEGRLIFSNIKKMVAYVLSNSFDEIILIFGSILLNLSFPLTIAQILWINLICDGPPDILLSFEPKEKSLMQEKPKAFERQDILSIRIKFLIAAVSLITGLIALFSFKYYLNHTANIVLARTVSFGIIATASLTYIFAYKNLGRLLIQSENFFENKYLFVGVLYGFLLVFAAVYVPFLNRLLGTQPLGVSQWLLILAVGIISTLTVELVKLFTIFKNHTLDLKRY